VAPVLDDRLIIDLPPANKYIGKAIRSAEDSPPTSNRQIVGDGHGKAVRHVLKPMPLGAVDDLDWDDDLHRLRW
jgi:hypothetical protein